MGRVCACFTAFAVSMYAWGWGWNPAPVRAHDATSSPSAMAVPAVVEAVTPSVVTILTRGVPEHPFQHPTSPSSGTGLILDGLGNILTNHHIIQGAKHVIVGLPSGQLTPGRVVARDFLMDLAVVKINAKDLVPANLGRSARLQIGETVVAIGNPFALKGGATATVGVVSALNRAILPPNGETLYDLIQTDAAINPGSSGGPLVDLSGQVVGVSVAVAPGAQAISYAISIDAAFPHIESMLERGTVLRPDLGMTLVTVTPSIVASFNLNLNRGVLAAQVTPSEQAAVSGLQAGDVITAIDNRPVHNLGDFWHGYLSPEDQRPAQLSIYGKEGQAVISLPRISGAQVTH